MRKPVLRRPSPALVVACAALLVALGGTSIAAVTAVPNNSVGTAQLKNNAVTAAKIASNAVTGAKINANAVAAAKIAANAVTNAKIANAAVDNAKLAANAVTTSKIAANAVTSAQVQDGSLLATDFAPGQLPSGSPGAGKLVLRTATLDIPKSNTSELSVACKPGEQAVSGGATWTDKGDLNLVLAYSAPVYSTNLGRATGWVARGRNNTTATRTFVVQALCGKAS
jgi:hypothetical protein